MNICEILSKSYVGDENEQFKISGISDFLEFKNTRELMEEDVVREKLPFEGLLASKDFEDFKKIYIEFDNECDYNTSMCVEVEGKDSNNFTIKNLLSTFWEKFVIPEEIKPEDYEENKWVYDVYVKFGNIFYASKNKGKKEYNVAVIPYRVDLIERENDDEIQEYIDIILENKKKESADEDTGSL